MEPELARKEYLRRLEKHITAVRAACQRLGVAHHQLTTDQPLELALFDFLKTRMQRGKLIKRAGQ